MSEEFEVPRLNGERGALFIAAFIYGAVVFSVQVGTSEHYAAAISTSVAFTPAKSELSTHVVILEIDQVKPAELTYAFL